MDQEREAFYDNLTKDWQDIGHGHKINWASWSPDRELNPQYKDVPDVEHAHLTIYHKTPSGESCMGSIIPDYVPDHLKSNCDTWQIISEDPLTVSPSILCICGDHGYIRDGQWHPA